MPWNMVPSDGSKPRPPNLALRGGNPQTSLKQVLCVHSLLEHTDVTIMYDNEALYDICRRRLGIVVLTIVLIKSICTQN